MEAISDFADDGQDAGVVVSVVLSAHRGQLAIAEKANQRKSGEELLDEAEVVVRLAVQADASPEYLTPARIDQRTILDLGTWIFEVRLALPRSTIHHPRPQHHQFTGSR